MQVSQPRKKKYILRAIVIIACIMLLTLVCAAMFAVGTTQLAIDYLEQHQTEATVDYRYHLPPAAKIIEAKADSADVFGDFSMSAAFTLPDEELEELLKKGFDWFYPMRKGYVSDRNWITSTLPQKILEVNEIPRLHLENGPKDSIIYTYLYEWVDGGWWRLVIVDREKNLVYYYRESW
jgi:hypothetical protein